MWCQFSISPLFRLVLVLKVYSCPSNAVSTSTAVLISCTCHFQRSPPFFLYFGFFCLQVSSVLISALTWRGEGGHSFRLTRSVVLWREMDTTNKFHWHVCGVLTLDGPHCVCHSPRQHEFPGSTLLRLQGALQWHCPKWTLCFMYFPGLNSSGDWVLGECTVPGWPCILCTSPIPATWFPWCPKSTVPGVLCVSSRELTSGCGTPGRCDPSTIPGRCG